MARYLCTSRIHAKTCSHDSAKCNTNAHTKIQFHPFFNTNDGEQSKSQRIKQKQSSIYFFQTIGQT